MESDNVSSLQNHVRENSEELQKYLLDIDCWEKEMKKKEEELKLIHTTIEEEIPPIRNLLYRSKKKNRHKNKKDKNISNGVQTSENEDQTLEKVDVDSQVKEDSEDIVQNDKNFEGVAQDDENSEDITCNDENSDELTQNDENSDREEEMEILRKKQMAYLHKEKGNEFFKKGNYDSAINSYTLGMQLDPDNALLPANRAMAFLKKGQFQLAENDCTLSLSIDKTYVKAYLRRGTARKNLNRLSLAKDDFSRVLEFEPENKQAQLELKQITEKFPIEDTVEILNESEVIKAQELWPQFLGNKAVKCPEENVELYQDSDLFNAINNCIFSDSKPVSLQASSIAIADLGPEIQIEVTKMDEHSFVTKEEERMNSLMKARNETSPNTENASEINLELVLPPVPNTAFQFLADWNDIVHHPDLKYKYLKQFLPEQLSVVFKQYMEPAIFRGILETLSASFLKHGDDVFDYMKYLANVGRFNIMIMFLSDKEKKDLNKLLEYVRTCKRPETEISDVLKKYRA